jgi:cysteine desulfurase
MLPWLYRDHANPHAEHPAGQRAAAAVDTAKDKIAHLIGADANDIIFTSGATESNNLVLQGLLAGRRGTLVASAIEHKCVLEVGRALEAQGVTFTTVPVDRSGRVAPAAVAEAACKAGNQEVVVASIMHANNEIGTVQPIAEIAEALAATDCLLHVDAAQTCGKIELDITHLGVDSLSVSAHKLAGPAGIGAVYVAPRAKRLLRPLMHGGGQQGGLRPGTVPVFLAVGFGAACDIAARRLQDDARHAEHCVTAFLGTLQQASVRFVRLGDCSTGLPGLLSLRFPGCAAGDLLDRLARHVYASAGAACSSGEIRASYVCRAIGLSEDEAFEVIRFGFGRSNSVADAEQAGAAVADACRDSLRV